MICTAHNRKNCTADACKRAARRRPDSSDSSAPYTDTFAYDTSAYSPSSSFDSGSSSSSSDSGSSSSSSCD
uniref:hypothetical protein n=1 Tax=Paractinoplanes polyasparticus TaxID=2856853 RepID=UPI001C85D458|nr:hypothetical protein [Actinoplanes polyasparticus]